MKKGFVTNEDVVKEKRMNRTLIFTCGLLLGAVAVLLITLFISSVISEKERLKNKYDTAEMYYDKGEYMEAYNIWTSMGDWEDALQRADEALNMMYYTKGIQAYNNDNLIEAIKVFSTHIDFKDCKKYLEKSIELYYLEQIKGGN